MRYCILEVGSYSALSRIPDSPVTRCVLNGPASALKGRWLEELKPQKALVPVALAL